MADGGRFAKGASGNPKGRPLSAPELKEAARKCGAQAIADLLSIAGDKKVAKPVRIKAWDLLLQRGYGKPSQEITGPQGGPIQVARVKAVDLSKLSDEEFDAYRRLAEKVAVTGDDGGPEGDEGGDPGGGGETIG